ncbi:MAG: hypothetical protein GF315_13370, partial [candidate division Zixibacteria bacterium]|nr:hypothetical protein [candidate division Zixibacteria bacterium]
MKRNILIIFSLILLLTSASYAQDTLWTRTFGGTDYDYGRAVTQTPDGGFAVAAVTRSFGGSGDDIYLIKLDENGDTLWTSLIIDGNYSEPFAIIATGNDELIMAGRRAEVSFYDGYLVKTDALGNVLWSQTYGIADQQEWMRSLSETSDGGFIMAGKSETGIFVVRTDSVGNEQWSRVYPGYDGRAAYETNDGGYIIAGTKYITDDYYFHLIKTDETGEPLWTRNWNISGNNHCNDMNITPDGGYILAGLTTLNGQSAAIKSDADGNSQWATTYYPIGTTFYGVDIADDGGYVFCGRGATQGNNFHLVKTNPDGDTLWTANYGGDEWEEALDIYTCSDGGFVLTGWTESYGPGNRSIYVVRTAPYGQNDPPIIENIIHTPDNPNEGEDVEVCATITDPGLSASVVSAELYYDNGSGYVSIAMTDTGGDIFCGTVPGQSGGTNVDYYIVAEDDMGETATSDTLSFYVNGGPIIADISHNPSNPNGGEDVEVCATITDPLIAGVVSADLYYDNGTGYVSVAMTDTGGDIYCGTVPGQDGGVTVEYYIVAEDDNGGTATSDTFSFYVNAGPIIADVGHYPEAPQPGDDVEVSATVTDPGLMVTVDYVELYYDDGSGYVSVPMDADENLYTGTIPGLYDGATVDYYIYAMDDNGSYSVSDTFTYIVEPPVITIYMIPINPPLVVPPGGFFRYMGVLANNTADPQVTDVWIMMNVPGIGIYGPVDRFNNVNIPPMKVLSTPGITQNIPMSAPEGLYDYIGYCGDYPDVVVDSEYFQFTVDGELARGGADEWLLTGWFDDGHSIPSEFGLNSNYPN